MPSAKCRPVKIAEAVTQSVSMETSSFFSSPCSSQVRTVLILRTGSAGHGSLLHLALDEHVACKVPQALTARGGGGPSRIFSHLTKPRGTILTPFEPGPAMDRIPHQKFATQPTAHGELSERSRPSAAPSGLTMAAPG